MSAMPDDAPLPDGTIQSLRARWKVLYNNTDFGPYLTPADTMNNKNFRENLRMVQTVQPMDKMKSLIQSAIPTDIHTYALGSALLTLNGDVQNAEIRSIIDYYLNMTLHFVSQSFVGSHETESHWDQQKKVIYSPLDVNIMYCTDALRIASGWECDSNTALEALRSKGVRTRTCMVQLQRQGWPQGEAHKQALLETLVEWKSSPIGKLQVMPNLSEFSGGSTQLPQLSDHRQPLQHQPKKPKKTQLKGTSCSREPLAAWMQ